MSTHNICFHGEIRKIFYGYPLFSGAVVNDIDNDYTWQNVQADLDLYLGPVVQSVVSLTSSLRAILLTTNVF